MPQSPSYTNVGRVSDIRRRELALDRQPACSYYCEGQCLKKKVVPAEPAHGGGILAPRDFAVSDDDQGRRHVFAPPYQPRRRRYLRLTEIPSDESDEKLRDPCSARSAEICRRAPVAHVFDSDGESSQAWCEGVVATDALDVECEIIGSKSETYDFRRERELVPSGQQVMAAFAPKSWLPFLAETQVDRVGHRRDIAFFLHASSCELHVLDQC
jgi:hypothetical protein